MHSAVPPITFRADPECLFLRPDLTPLGKDRRLFAAVGCTKYHCINVVVNPFCRLRWDIGTLSGRRLTFNRS